MEKSHVSGVTKDCNIARIALVGLVDQPGVAYKIFSILAKKRINVDIILQSIGRDDTKDISFTIAKDNLDQAKEILEEYKDNIGYNNLRVSDTVAKVSMVGAGMINNSGVAAAMFEALYEANINIHMISTSEIKVSVLIDANEADRAVQVIHDKFFPEQE